MSENIYKVVGRNGKAIHGRAYFSKGHAKLSANHNYNAEVVKGTVVWEGSGEHVILTKKEHELLVHSATFLQCLEDAGVDNWQGIDYAYEMMNKGVDFDEL